MQRIFNTTEQQLLALYDALHVSDRADFCIGYFRLQVWKQIGAFSPS
jgi:hypothetical protein